MSAVLDLRDSDPALDRHADDEDDVVDDDDDEKRDATLETSRNRDAALETSRTNFRMAINSPRSLGSSSSSSKSLSSSSSPPVDDVSGRILDSNPDLLLDSAACERIWWDSLIRMLSEEVADMLSSSFSGIKFGFGGSFVVAVVVALSSVMFDIHCF